MKILITGSSGFMGQALTQKLNGQGHELTLLNSKNGDLTIQDSLKKFNNIKYDQIFHLAAWTQAGDFCLHHPGEQWIINQQMNTHVLSWWQKDQPQAKFICIGTSCVYDPAMELKEENYLTGMPIESLFTYAMTKRMLYAGLLALNKQYKLNYLCVVPSTLYGPGYHTDGRQMHFIFDLIRKIIRGKLNGDKVVLWGDGHQKRELVFVDDFVNLMTRLSAQKNNDLINIGAGAEFSIRHFAQLICKEVGYDFEKIEFDPSRYVGAKSKCLEISKLKKIVPDLAYTPLEQGLSQTIAWFMKEKDKLL
jgi:GDP-L-fucose synthase